MLLENSPLESNSKQFNKIKAQRRQRQWRQQLPAMDNTSRAGILTENGMFGFVPFVRGERDDDWIVYIAIYVPCLNTLYIIPSSVLVPRTFNKHCLWIRNVCSWMRMLCDSTENRVPMCKTNYNWKWNSSTHFFPYVRTNAFRPLGRVYPHLPNNTIIQPTTCP